MEPQQVPVPRRARRRWRTGAFATVEAWSRIVERGNGRERSVPGWGEAVLELSFGPAATPVLPRAVAFAAQHADHLVQNGEKARRATRGFMQGTTAFACQ